MHKRASFPMVLVYRSLVVPRYGDGITNSCFRLPFKLFPRTVYFNAPLREAVLLGYRAVVGWSDRGSGPSSRLNSLIKALASLRSAVSKPSVNQP